ncbi:hypothetical protein ABFS82_13G064400 [Erythranthe guttata]|uniref:Uncharacterized protein n=1 Tax=Erythranthe guttata TaxID=4155 RepID=A0A022QLG3_ERYGU|nr:hypothetical protein MIMGU_mgv1a017339mg [Erythranthe guttata]
MVRLSTFSVALILVWIVFLSEASEARKLVVVEKGRASDLVTSSLITRGSVINADHVMAEKRFVRVDGRSLGSVPSPGNGH